MSVELDENAKKLYCKALAENLAVFRAKIGVSQEELASRVGLSRSLIANIESKRSDMSWRTFVMLSLLFLKNEHTAPIFKALNIYDEKLNDYLMLEEQA